MTSFSPTMDGLLARHRAMSEKALLDPAYDFTAKFLAVGHLHTLAETHPEIIVPQTLCSLEKLFYSPEHAQQTQAFFLYKEAANTLCSVMIHAMDAGRATEVFSILKRLLGATSGHAQRAVAEGMGSFPFAVKGPSLPTEPVMDLSSTDWEGIVRKSGLSVSRPPILLGRSLVAAADQKPYVLASKLAREGEPADSLGQEAVWMMYLRACHSTFPVRFHVPRVLEFNGKHVFRFTPPPLDIEGNARLHPDGCAIAFVAHSDYYIYPNEPGGARASNEEAFKDVMFANAWLLGRLASQGIVHTAPLPLFHNRIQRDRRADGGAYEWVRAGRLDRWLHSCAYPNVGRTGLRDFEHVISFSGGSKRLYRHIGTHLLSLQLLIGSHFRNKDKGRLGLDEHGRPVDARDLFDRAFFKELIQGVFLSYYHGFVGVEFTGDFPLNWDKLSSRMIDEMGVDRHMEEVLRAVDQQAMTQAEWRDFLKRRGFSDENIDRIGKGEQDIVVESGPHLGGFNQTISIPELIESVGAMSALCIAGRYMRETRNGNGMS